jgi:hypothetical protein
MHVQGVTHSVFNVNPLFQRLLLSDFAPRRHVRRASVCYLESWVAVSFGSVFTYLHGVQLAEVQKPQVLTGFESDHYRPARFTVRHYNTVYV